MKTCRNSKRFLFSWICAVAPFIVITGCQSERVSTGSAKECPINDIRISAITEFVPDLDVLGRTQIKTLVELFDNHGTSIKAPCQLRFEFYEFRSVSSDPRGQRLLIWPGEDLTAPDKNDKHWEAFLRGYEFYLPLDVTLENGKKYVLEATCLVAGQRYHDLFKMQYQP